MLFNYLLHNKQKHKHHMGAVTCTN